MQYPFLNSGNTMMTQPEREFDLRKDQFLLNEKIVLWVQAFQPKFKKIIYAHTLFHASFVSICLLELVSFVIFFPFLKEHSLIAFALALLFLTLFSYYILYLYSHTRKPEQLKELIAHFSKGAKKMIAFEEEIPDSHMALGDIFCKLAYSLDGVEYTFFKTPKFLEKLKPHLENFSCWAYWHDVYSIKEMALIATVEEQIKLVKCDATSLEAHTALANAYIMLSAIYVAPLKEEDEERRCQPAKRYSEEFRQKFQAVAKRAIEEFKILSEYSPNDPWVHEQLAYSYCDLKMPLEAINEYEQILKLNPGDSDTLYKLGILYFQLGRNAHGLHVYEQLKRLHYKKADQLISHYGAYNASSAGLNEDVL